MKANTIQLLIAVIAVVGTLSSTIPQSFADNAQPYEAVCLPDLALANNGDLHSMLITGGGNANNDLVIAASITPDSTTPYNLANFDLLKRTGPGTDGLFNTADDDLTLIAFDVGGVSGTNADIDFAASFLNLPDGEYVVVVCYRVGFGEGAPIESHGFYHGDFAVRVIDLNDPTCIAPEEELVIQDDDIPGVPSDTEGIPDFEATFDCADDFDNMQSGIAGMTLVRSDGEPLNADYEVGTTTLTKTCTDNEGNESMCSQDIVVNRFEEPGCDSVNLEGGVDNEFDRFCIEGEFEQPFCGVRLSGEGLLNFGPMSPNELSEVRTFEVEATGTPDVVQAFKILCNGWKDQNDLLGPDILDADVTHMARPTGGPGTDLYGGTERACEEFEKRFAHLTTGDLQTVEVMFQANLNFPNFVGGVLQDIFLSSQECAIPDTDLDECSGVFGFPPFDVNGGLHDHCQLG